MSAEVLPEYICDSECESYDLPESVYEWFALTYSSFAVLPRVFMEQMPIDWQHRFTQLMRELDDEFPNIPVDRFRVFAVKNGRMARMPDVMKCYRRPLFDEIELCRNKNR